MSEIEIIEQKIAELKDKADQVKGKKCEVYTRIVGYYRSVDNWNEGKKEEFKKRKNYVLR